MVIVETQEIESPEIENNSGFSVWNNLINKRGVHDGTPFFSVSKHFLCFRLC